MNRAKEKHHTPFDREGSTLGVMDDLQIAIHSYDGCARGCPGCVVDKHFKNHARGEPILHEDQMKAIHQRVLEYYEWCKKHLNSKQGGYFGCDGYKINHFSYTFRFGNHSELPVEALNKISAIMDAPYKVFSTAPTPDLSMFKALKEKTKSDIFLEVIYDPVADKATDIRSMILNMRSMGIQGYPEVLITRRLLNQFNPKRFVEEALWPLNGIETQVQFGRYSPSKTRGFSQTQVVPLDEEVLWLAEVAKLICEKRMDIHPIPIGEYAVTFLDEYQEWQAISPEGCLDEDKLPDLPETDWALVKEKTRDIFRSSLYIDHNLDLFIWSESMGQHVLDKNFGFPSLGNIKESSIESLVNQKDGVLEQMLNKTMSHLLIHKKCAPCRYKSFCASHAIPFFRAWHKDDGQFCYGYLPVIREFQQHPVFLKNMIDGFKKLNF